MTTLSGTVEQRYKCIAFHCIALHCNVNDLWFVLQVSNVTGDTANTFLEYIQRNIPEGVSMSVEQTSLEPFPEFFELPPQAQAFLDENKQHS